MDILGNAVSDYYFKGSDFKLWVHDNHGPKEEMDINIYFRNAAEMPDLEILAMQLCKGKTLDIGACAGSHALHLQEQGINVTAIDISEGAVRVMKDRGVEKALVQDIFTFEGQQFDTLLLLMNGIGLTQNINGLHHFLRHIKKLLNEKGQLLFDSSDLAYLYEYNIPQLPHYYGEVRCRYEYRKQLTDWFSWLFVDQKTLKNIAYDEGWETEILFVDDSDQYLARLTLK